MQLWTQSKRENLKVKKAGTDWLPTGGREAPLLPLTLWQLSVDFSWFHFYLFCSPLSVYFLYKKGKAPQLQDGASETVLSRYVKRPIQRNYTSHLSIPPNHQAPYSTIQGVTKNLIKPFLYIFLENVGTSIYSFWRIADLFDSDWSWRLENQKPNFELWLFDSWQPKSPPPLKHSRRDQV